MNFRLSGAFVNRPGDCVGCLTTLLVLEDGGLEAPSQLAQRLGSTSCDRQLAGSVEALLHVDMTLGNISIAAKTQLADLTSA